MSLKCPLQLHPVLMPKVWGGAALAPFIEGQGEAAAALWKDATQGDTPIGEVWLISDQGEHSSEIASGPYAGRTLRGLMLSERESLIGEAEPGDDDTFPLLVKLLDAQANLSVQVHPDEQSAGVLGGSVKEECWYVLDAEPGAEIFLGLAEGVDAVRFAEGAETPDVVDLLSRHPVSAGHGVRVPGGTVHSIGAGLVIAEVQTNSDTTYRVYDWGRVGLDGAPRETHLEEAFRSIDYGQNTEPPGRLTFDVCPSIRTQDLPGDQPNQDSVNRVAQLGAFKQFVAEVMEVHEPVEMTAEALPTVLVVLAGSGRIETGDGETHSLAKGGAWVLPADLASAKIVEADGELQLLRARPARAK